MTLPTLLSVSVCQPKYNLLNTPSIAPVVAVIGLEMYPTNLTHSVGHVNLILKVGKIITVQRQIFTLVLTSDVVADLSIKGRAVIISRV